jgi:protocatechuate 3,4-dioxygenase beta subunit
MQSDALNRRRALLGMMALAAGPWTVLRAEGALLEPTPADAEGPFYPVEIPDDSDNDLLHRVGRGSKALGQPTYLHGAVTDRAGARIDGARVEIWQCDHGGVYHHPDDGGRPDENFQGFGAMVTDRAGGYHFRTLRPVPYTGRTPHIHFRVTAAGFDRLTTQLYVAEEVDRNQRDSLYRRHGPAAQLITTSFHPIQDAPGAALAARFDIVLG